MIHLLTFAFLFIVTMPIFPRALAQDGLFIAAGGGGRILTSRDGANWTTAQEWSAKWADDSELLHWACAGAGKIVVSGGGGWSRATQAGHILVSDDGKNFHEAAKFPNRISPVQFHGGRFVATGHRWGMHLRIDAFFDYLAKGAKERGLIPATPHTIARYARVLADLEGKK